MKGMTPIILMLVIITLSSCLNHNQNSESLEPESEELITPLLNNEEVTDDDTSIDAGKQVTVKDLLSRFKDWNGNKSFGKNIYTLDYDNDAYILTIDSNASDKNIIDWTEMIYFKPLQESYSINIEELKHLQELAAMFDIENEEWTQHVINEDLPYEKDFNNWKLIIDYFKYNGKKEGISLNLYNLNKPTPTPKLQANGLNKKRQEFANKIRGALSPVCDRAYFNSKGELILEVKSEWYTVTEGTKKDIIYSFETQLRNVKKELEVEGYGQFFSPTGRPLESFYAD